MAYIVGFITKQERSELEKRGWEVESAESYGLVGLSEEHLMNPPGSCEVEACVVFVDSSMFDVMSGPDWEK